MASIENVTPQMPSDVIPQVVVTRVTGDLPLALQEKIPSTGQLWPRGNRSN
jgi:hypothetical protein